MTRQLEPIATAHGKAALRASTEALCQDLEGQIERFEADTATEGDLRQAYELRYRANAVAVILALMYHAPASFGFTLAHNDAGRTFNSPDLELAEGKLHDGVVAYELKTIVHTLRDLLGHLPES